MIKSEKMIELLKEYRIAQCGTCKDFYIHIAVVIREGDLLDVVRQGGSEFCPYCGALQKPTTPVTTNLHKGDTKKYNRKRLKIKGRDGFPIVKVYKCRDHKRIRKCLKS